jgi:hypothetical protein
VQGRLAATTPVVVVPAFNATGLGIVRDLGRLGIAYSDALGRPFAGPRQKEGVRWLDAWRDVRDSLVELRHGDLRLRPWMASLRNVRVDAVCALDDPGPVAASAVGATRRRLRRGIVGRSR